MKNSIVPAESSQGIISVGSTAALAARQDGSWEAGSQASTAVDTAARLRRAWAAIKRFWWLVAAIGAVGTGAGIAATRYVDPVFMAQGGLLIADLTTPHGSGGGPFRNPTLLPTGAWLDVFKSFAVIEEVVARERLWYTPKSWQDSVALDGKIRPTMQTSDGDYVYTLDSADNYTLTEAKAGVIERGVFGDTVGRKAYFAWLPTKEGLMGRRWVGFTTKAVRPIAAQLAGRIEISMQDNSNFLRPLFSWPEQRAAGDILNAWMQSFVDITADLRTKDLGETADRLAAQRTVALEEVRKAQFALQNFRTQNITRPNEGSGTSVASAGTGDILANDFIRSQRELDNLRQDRLRLEAVAARGLVTESPDIINSIPSAQGYPRLIEVFNDLIKRESELRDLQLRGYRDSLPAVINAKAAAQTLRTRTIPMIAGDVARALRDRENQLSRTILSDSLKLRAIPAQSIQEAALRRDLSVAENLYLKLDNEYETKRLATSNSVPDVTIIDHARPTAKPLRNTILMLIGGGLVGSLLLGIALALLLDMIDHRFRYPEQITHDLKLDVLGAVPAVPAPNDAASDPEAMLQSVEAFRGLRMSLHHAFDAPPVMVTISSPGAGDGKSMVASNLALSFSEAGYRTLLIDGDIRRGKLHSIFGIDRRPGLLDYLAGDVDLQTIMREVPLHKRLSVIPSGTRRHRGPELLTSSRLSTLINTLRSRYDVILIDSAPLAAGIDAYALGALTGNMVLVMRTGYTDRRVAKAKLKLLDRLPIRLIGAIVNAVPATGLYSEYSYLYGYTAESDHVGASEAAHEMAGEAVDESVEVLQPVDATKP